jgi:hypothetical protein
LDNDRRRRRDDDGAARDPGGRRGSCDGGGAGRDGRGSERAGQLLGDLARIAARTATDVVRATLDEPEVAEGIVLCSQTHDSLLN